LGETERRQLGTISHSAGCDEQAAGGKTAKMGVFRRFSAEASAWHGLCKEETSAGGIDGAVCEQRNKQLN
jgi:hypothetical protein